MGNMLQELFNIETARTETDSYRNVVYSISDGALTIESASYTWTGVRVYLDNCTEGKKYRISLNMRTENPNGLYPVLWGCGGAINPSYNSECMYMEFTCTEDVPYLELLWSNAVVTDFPVTYYNFKLIEI